MLCSFVLTSEKAKSSKDSSSADSSHRIDRIEIDELRSLIASKASAAVMFLDRLDQRASFFLVELEGAVNDTVKDFGSKPFSASYIGRNFSAEEQAEFKLAKFPTLRVYLPSGPVNYDARLFARQIGHFLKRQLRSRVNRVSALLKDLDQYDKLESESEPFVIFCGSEISPDFQLFEKAAKDNFFLYYHAFEADFCTRLNAKRLGAEESLWNEVPYDYELGNEDRRVWLEEEKKVLHDQHEQEYINDEELKKKLDNLKPPKTVRRTELKLDDSIWRQFILNQSVIFVVYRPNLSFEILNKFSSIEQLRHDILFASVSNFYTDFDKAYDYLFDHKFKANFLALFSPTNQTKDQAPCNEVYRLSLQHRLKNQKLKFGCFSREELSKFGLEIYDKVPLDHTVFFFAYSDLKDETKEAKISRPFRYRLDEAADDNIEPFLQGVLAQQVPRYLIAEDPPIKAKNLPVKYLVRSTFRSWVEEQLASTNVAVLTYYSRSSTPKNVTTSFRNLAIEMKDHLAFGDLDVAVNEIDDLLEDDDSQKLLLWLRGSDFFHPIKILNPSKIDTLRGTLASHIPSLAHLDPEENTESDL